MQELTEEYHVGRAVTEELTEECHVGRAVAEELDEGPTHEAADGPLGVDQVADGHDWVHHAHRHRQHHLQQVDGTHDRLHHTHRHSPSPSAVFVLRSTKCCLVQSAACVSNE